MWIVALLLLPLGAYGALVAAKGRKGALEFLFGPVEREPVAFETLELEPTPNQYLVCPLNLCQAPAHAASPTFDAPVEELEQAWLALMEDEPNVMPIGKGPAAKQYEFEALTPLIHFPDTVTVRFLTSGEQGSTLAIYSRSHYGHSDFGANEKRVKNWLALLEARLAR